jgi:hypothetical protein
VDNRKKEIKYFPKVKIVSFTYKETNIANKYCNSAGAKYARNVSELRNKKNDRKGSHFLRVTGNQYKFIPFSLSSYQACQKRHLSLF